MATTANLQCNIKKGQWSRSLRDRGRGGGNNRCSFMDNLDYNKKIKQPVDNEGVRG